MSTTRALLTRASGGQQEAWNELVRRHTNLLWSIARSFRLDQADAADAVQTTWLRLVEHLDRVQDPDRLVGWLATTVRRECLRIKRIRDRERPQSYDDPPFEIPDPAEPLDAKLLRDESYATLWHAFAGMPEHCQRLLRVLMSSPPPSYDTVSAALQMPVGSIGPTRKRCLARLRSLFGRHDCLPSQAPTAERES
ncbi:MAG: sigma-70 family RNA polymerase sigma factor [Actinobacteria bacterium]|nr:sigma-70 family RNA polymerase sigma factor [Actinomycetota bacterium]MBI3685964.1 sigma-70 family RNA polymerase sigma factor [Actinomycetota bacterium]